MSLKTWMSIGVAAAVAAVALMTGALVLHETAGRASAQEVGVEVGDNFFEGQTITVAVGDTVTWNVEGSFGHTVTSDTGAFDSGEDPLREGDTFSFTFDEPGTYPYYCRFHGGPGGVGMSGTVVVEAAGEPQPAPAAPEPTTAAPEPDSPSGGATGESITVDLGPGRDASQPGTAVLTEQGDQTMVTIDIASGAAGVPQPVHIHAGTCDTLGAVEFPLTNIVDGQSTTMVDARLSDLMTGGFAINAHMSQAEINTYVACGNIPASGTSGGAAGEGITVTLGPGRDASQPGTAVLTEQGDQTMVTIDITPGAAGVPQPVHIHEGTCASLGAVKYPLTNIVDGKSTTVVDARLSDLLTGGFTINAHMSQAEINTYVACGNIPAVQAAGQTAGQLPTAGTAGLQGGDDSGISPWWYALAAAGGLVLAGGFFGLWRARARR